MKEGKTYHSVFCPFFDILQIIVGNGFIHSDAERINAFPTILKSKISHQFLTIENPLSNLNHFWNFYPCF